MSAKKPFFRLTASLAHLLFSGSLAAILCTAASAANDNSNRDDPPPSRWQIAPDGNGIVWDVPANPADIAAAKSGRRPRRNASCLSCHQDTFEMSGLHISPIITYGTYGLRNRAGLVLKRKIVWPLLRKKNPHTNKTHDHWTENFEKKEDSPRFWLNGKELRDEDVRRFRHSDGTLTIESSLGAKGEIALKRTLFPSPDKPAYFEEYNFTNTSANPVKLHVPAIQLKKTSRPDQGVYGAYVIETQFNEIPETTLAPNASLSSCLIISGRRADVPLPPLNAAAEKARRVALARSWQNNIRLETPDAILNTAFAFAKIRTTESIFDTAAGPLHSPGGDAYYAAVWANDQAEYANPWFAFTGDKIAILSAINCFQLYAARMNPEWNPLPSSIIDEGRGHWDGAGDRGDMAMLAYGATRFALAQGDKAVAEKLWPLIEWCLEYSRRKIDHRGVVASDCDELENRLPAGKANLCTSSLLYDALLSAVFLGRDLGKPAPQLDAYSSQASALASAIEKHFGSQVANFHTYRYFDKTDIAQNSNFKAYIKRPDALRAWICIPLTCGILQRAKGTTDALFSPLLWTNDGLASEAGQKTFWDRATLYALRGVFSAGETERALEFLSKYSRRRLLGEHVPYPVESFPEGNQRHLAAESALYCRIFSEGVFGIRPTGLRSFACTPRLPKAWQSMALRRIHAFGEIFDVEISRAADTETINIGITPAGKKKQEYTAKPGKTVHVKF
ncbi:MAG: hypothetical protein LBS59_04360 [Puniceicoccales bacterium]|jgi:hypothetical protein|nr:hypothetical protein [Puniceicoccales bacterium]